MPEERIELLQRMAIFGGIREDTLHFLLNLAPAVSAPAKSYFFHEGDNGDVMFVLQTGKVAVMKTWKARQYTLTQLGAGDCFGEMALIDLYPRSASVIATEECRALKISSGDLYSLYEHDLEQFTVIQMNIAREISRRLRLADNRIFQAEMVASTATRDYAFRSF
jgi:CRP-like cAMP-binding protein